MDTIKLALAVVKAGVSDNAVYTHITSGGIRTGKVAFYASKDSPRGADHRVATAQGDNLNMALTIPLYGGGQYNVTFTHVLPDPDDQDDDHGDY